MRTWREHLAWAKARALAYLPNDPKLAVDSMASDLMKHPEHPDGGMVVFMALDARRGDASSVRKWIEGWY